MFTTINIGTYKIVILKCFAILISPIIGSCFCYMMQHPMGDYVYPESIINAPAFINHMNLLKSHVEECFGLTHKLEYFSVTAYWEALNESYTKLIHDIEVIKNWEVNPNMSDDMKVKIQAFMEVANSRLLLLRSTHWQFDFELSASLNAFNLDDIGKEVRLNYIKEAIEGCGEVYDHFLSNIKYMH